MRKLRVGDLDDAERAAIADQLVDIFMESFAVSDRALVARNVLFRGPDVNLWLGYDDRGDVAAFVSCETAPVEVNGRACHVMDAGLYARAGLRHKGVFLSFVVFIEAVSFWLRHPRARLCYVSEAMTPASYKLALRWPDAHPRRGRPIPEEITALVSEWFTRHGRIQIDGDPWRTTIPVPLRFRDPARIRRYVERSRDPDVAYFVSRNPGYLDGQWLVVHLTWRPRHIARYVVTALRDVLAQTMRRPRDRFC